MCKVRQLPRITFYYEAKKRTNEDTITTDIIEIFHASYQNYGTRKIKKELKKKGKVVSRRRIGRIMNEQGLVSSYTVAQFKFKNQLIDEALQVFNISRSLSMKGCPYDNAVAKATYKIIKTEFVNRRHFDSLEELSRQFHDYIHWYNYIRIHGTLDYLSPIEFKIKHLKKIV